jgi:hypothetical protein
MEIENEEHLLLFDSGRAGHFLRVPIAILGILMLSFGAREISFYLFGYDLGIHQTAELSSPVPAFLSLLGLGLLFLSVWFLRKRIFLDANRGDIIVRVSTPFGGRVHRVSLSDATGVYREFCQGLRGDTYWNIGISFKDRGQCPLARAEEREDEFVRKLSEKIQLPILEIPG